MPHRIFAATLTASGLMLTALTFSLRSTAQHPSPKPALLVAISRDEALLIPTEVSPTLLSGSKVLIGLIAFVMPGGQLREPLCNSDNQSGCKEIESAYLSHPRTYEIISEPDPLRVMAAPTKLSDCFETTAKGEVPLVGTNTALAASAPDLFQKVQAKLHVTEPERTEIQARANAIVEGQIPNLFLILTRIEKVRLTQKNGDFIIVEAQNNDYRATFFGIWHVTPKGYSLVASNSETGFQDDEHFIGTIKVKNQSSEYLVTSTRDSESYSFNVYAFEGGSLRRIYQGGGANC
jgi:hypothetical protein